MKLVAKETFTSRLCAIVKSIKTYIFNISDIKYVQLNICDIKVVILPCSELIAFIWHYVSRFTPKNYKF